ncbi:hypothetical protein P4O66_012671, partial [Electrophorus voltai]
MAETPDMPGATTVCGVCQLLPVVHQVLSTLARLRTDLLQLVVEGPLSDKENPLGTPAAVLEVEGGPTYKVLDPDLTASFHWEYPQKPAPRQPGRLWSRRL